MSTAGAEASTHEVQTATDDGRVAHPAGGQERAGPKLPPVAELAVLSMAFVIAGGIYMAAHLPAKPPLTLATVLVVIAGVTALTDVVMLARLKGFAWSSFLLVAKWSLLAYLVISGMLEFIFIFDGTRGASLAVLTCMLALFAVDVPMLLAFSVARYQT